MRFCRRALLLLATLLYVACAQAQTDVLDSITVTPGATSSRVEIHLNVPVHYVSHAPARSGDVLRIEIDPVATLGSEIVGTQSIHWSASDTVPLNEVVYDNTEISSATITLQFARVTEYEVSPSPNPRSLTVIVHHRPVSGARAGAVQPAPPTRQYSYAINLASSTDPFSADELPGLEVLLEYRVYTTRFIKDGKTWNRLRIGFFRDRQQALQVLGRLQAYFPGAWITPVSDQERNASSGTLLAITGRAAPPPARGAAARPVTVPAGSLSVSDAEKIPGLMEQANARMTDKDYDGAIRLYTKVLTYPENAASRNALEYLGLARERKGQLAQAKAVYDSYLAQYPDGEGAQRVQQRLDALITASESPRQKLARTRARRKQAPTWDVFGGVSQFYRRDENTAQVNDQDKVTTVTQTSLSNDLDITGRMLAGNNDLRTRFSGGFLYDFLNHGEDNETTVSALYFDAHNKQNRLGMRLGRQSRSTGGVLGRFDGLLVELPLTRVLSVSMTGGFPVYSSRDGFDSKRYFYGASLELEGFATGWDADTFYIEQRVNGLIDRRAVGGELRYFDPRHSFFSLLDYDTFYNRLNTAQLLGNWTTENRTALNLLLDYRNSPILTTSNALQGQPVQTIEELLATYSEQDIYNLAQDRTANNRLVTVGVTRPLTERLQFSSDVTMSKLSSTPASGGVDAIPGTDNEFYYNLQLIGSNLIKDGDLTVLGLRYTDATTTRATSLSLNTRYPVTVNFRVNPRLSVDFRKNLNDSTNQFIYRPSARLTWNVKRRFRLEAELGGEWSDREIVSGTARTTSYFVTLGYRADF
jgi:tetratricopeptide (TPR) repeat protein